VNDSPKKISRRQFGRLSAAGAALPLASMLAKADHSHQGPHEVAGCPPTQLPEVEAKLANIVRKYGSRLSAAQRKSLKQILAYNESMLATIRAFPLHNGDAPASVLKVSFADSRSPETKG
jgi:hypothetical protein